MSSRLLLRSFVSERLTAAAEEIFQVFEGTIAKYEEEASSSKQEIDRLRGLLLEFASTQKNFSQSPTSKEETPIKQHDSEPEQSVCQSNPELRHIKEEDPEPWACQQQMEVEQVQEFRHAADFSYLPHSSSAWDENEQEDTKLPLQPETQNGEREEQQETETVQYALPVASTLTSQALAQKETVQDGSEDERPVASLTLSQTQMNQTGQSSFTAPGESAPLSHIDPFAPEHRCQLCDKVFSTINYLINHAFHLHAKLGDVLCAVCGQALETTDSLNVHLKSHKASKSCQVCGKHYNNTTALSEHMVSHTGLKLHRCHVCGKECSRKGDLKIHMRIHTGEKPFCCSFCSKSFTHSGHLRKHMRSHTGERPHRCDVCGRGFLQSTHLKYHLGTHAQKL